MWKVGAGPLAISPCPGSLAIMNGTPLVLSRARVGVTFIVGVAVSTRALAGPETPSFREQAACHKHREAGEHVQAAERCLAAYDALPDLPEALTARGVIAFDAGYSFRDAYDQTGEVKYLCGEIRLMIRFLDYLGRKVPAGERPYDRLDAQKNLDAARKDLGTRSCTEKPPDLMPAPEPAPEPAPPPSVDVVPPPPTAPRRGLKISGWTLFAVGLGLGVWSAAELAVGELTERGRSALIASVPGTAPGALFGQLEALKASGDAANRRAIVAGSLSGASLITGITLLAVDANRRRKHRRLALIPVTGPTFGVRLRLEF